MPARIVSCPSGIEGTAGRLYFDGFPTMLRTEALAGELTFEGRNRRPPRDPINALLSCLQHLFVGQQRSIAVLTGRDDHARSGAVDSATVWALYLDSFQGYALCPCASSSENQKPQGDENNGRH